jgi:hypothetical protein
VKKTNSKKLLLKQEKVRDLSPAELERSTGGAAGDGANSAVAGGSRVPGASKYTELGGLNFNYNYYGVSG